MDAVDVENRRREIDVWPVTPYDARRTATS
jgi:hypothetical protein